MEEEIDLRPYMVAVFRQWRLIAIITAAAIGAALLALSLPPVFTASSDVLILPSRSQLTFDSRFVTNNPSLSTDATSRRQTLVALASSQAIETQVLTKISPDPAGKAYQPGTLSQRVHVTSDGDLLHIEATGSDAQSAQALAEAWGQAYVLTVNDLYGRDNVMLRELESQLADAQKRYDQSQRDLETFIGSSPIVQVQQQITMTTQLLDQSVDGTMQLYAQYLAQARALEGTLRDAETLRQQVASGQTEGLGNALAAVVVRARVVTNVQLPIQLRFDDPSSFARDGATLADLDALIGLLRQRRDALMEESHLLAQAIGDGKDTDGGLPPSLQKAYAERLSALNKQFEEQTAQLKLLQQRRDLAFDSLSILQRKLEEQRVALGTSEVQVRFISATAAPPRSGLSRAILYAGAAAVASLFLSVLIVLGLTMLQPWLALRRSQNSNERPLDRPTPG